MAVCAAMRPKSSGRHVALLDLVAVLQQPLLVDLRRLGVDQLARLGVDGRLAGLLLDLVEQLLLEVGRQDQLVDAEVAAAAVHLHARVLGRLGRLLVGRQQRVLQRPHQAVGRDALLALEDADGFDDLLGHPLSLHARLLRLISAYGIDTTPSSAATVTSSSDAPTSSPVIALVAVARLAQAQARPAADEAPEVVRLAQRALRARRGDLERRSRVSRSRRCPVTRSHSSRRPRRGGR